MSKAGQPTKFCPEMVNKILEGIEAVLVLRQVAGYAEIHFTSLYNWLNDGKEDVLKGIWSEKARFFYAVKNAQAIEIKKLMLNIKKAIPNWQSQAWLLERCFREDFGQDAGIIQDLLAKCEKLEQDFKRFNDNPLQGALSDG